MDNGIFLRYTTAYIVELPPGVTDPNGDADKKAALEDEKVAAFAAMSLSLLFSTVTDLLCLDRTKRATRLRWDEWCPTCCISADCFPPTTAFSQLTSHRNGYCIALSVYTMIRAASTTSTCTTSRIVYINTIAQQCKSPTVIPVIADLVCTHCSKLPRVAARRNETERKKVRAI